MIAATICAGHASATTLAKAQVYDRASGEWRDHVQVDPRVNGEVRIRFVVSGDHPLALAFAGMNFQPMVSRWTPEDAVTLGAVMGNYNATTPRVDADFATGEEFGRVAAFAFGNILASNALTAHQNVIGGVNTLRIAQATATNAPGVGAILNNVNGSGGVPLTQNLTGPGRPPDAPDTVLGTTDIVVYGFKIVLGGDGSDRNAADPTADLTVTGVRFSTGGTSRWFGPDPPPIIPIEISDAPSPFVDATIDLVPSPGGVIGFAGGGCVWAASRRRRGLFAG